MRLRSFRVIGFRSVEDSGICHLASDITVLAGKNESGKSSVLEAIHLLVRTHKIEVPKRDKTKGSKQELSLITTFDLDDADLNGIGSELGIGPLKNKELIINWRETTLLTPGPLQQEIRDLLKSALQKESGPLFEELRAALLDLGVPEHDIPKEVHLVATRFSSMKSVDPALRDLRSRTQAYLRRRDAYDRTPVFLAGKVPPIVLFRSLEDQLPDSVDITDDKATESQVIQGFCSLANLDLSSLGDKGLSAHDRRMLVEDATDVYTEQFGPFWNQERLRIGAEIDGNQLVFVVRNQRETYSYAPSQRSKGFNWFVSFFLSLGANRTDDDRKAILLIDEPGLYLHAKAQDDLLAVLEDMATQGHQIILATHSPYLMRPNRLDRVRLVVRGEDLRTKVFNSWYGGADRDSITPLVTALGLDMARLLPNMSRYNVVVEGPTDYYYLQGMRNVLDVLGEPILPFDLVFVPCLGHANAGVLVSLFVGWNLECLIVLDQKGTKATKNLFAQQGFPQARILQVGATKDDSTLDLFSETDAAKYVFPEGTVLTSERLSTQSKKVAGASEVILARRFFDLSVSEPRLHLSDETLNRFKDLFRSIAKAFEVGTPGSAHEAS